MTDGHDEDDDDVTVPGDHELIAELRRAAATPPQPGDAADADADADADALAGDDDDDTTPSPPTVT